MRLLIFGINYSPELTGIGKYTSEMAEWFAKRDNDVSVITANPYYPEWKLHEGYRNRYAKQLINGVKVYRSPLYVPEKASGLKRILHELSFVGSALFVWLRFLFKPGPDVIICIAPPFHSGLFGLVYRTLKGGKIVYHIQDLQVDAAKDLNLIRSRILLDFFFSFEKFILKKMDLISSISDGMIRKIDQKVPDRQIYFLPNWVDINFIRPLPKNDNLRSDFGYEEDDFIILYSGNLGEKQGLSILIDAAKSMSPNTKVRFLICGEGAYKQELIRQARESGLSNISFHGLQPYDKLSRLLNTADVHLILQKKAAADLVLPSKLTSIAAAGGFSIVAAEKETSLYEAVNKHQIGFIVEPENTRSLIDSITKSLSTDLTTYRHNARKYAETYLNKEVILQSFQKKLEGIK